MMEKIKGLFIKYRELIMYLIFGVLTTVVSLVSYYLFLYLGVHYIAAQVVSWILAVAFAFVVNKIFVFEDKCTELSALLRQIWQFVAVRIASGVLETALLWIMVALLSIGEGIAKIPVSVLTVIINYIASKLFIFKKSR